MNLPARFPRVLVVDDQEDLHLLVGWIFRDLGFDVDFAGDGWTALERIRADAPDLLLLDVLMPGLDGWRVLERLASLPKRPPVVILTVCGDHVSFTRGVKLGVAAYVFKPFRIQQLVSTCERILGLQRTSDVARERRERPRRLLGVELLARSHERAFEWAKLVDLSESGALVDLDAPVDPGDPVRFSVRTLDGYVPLDVEGRVRWRTAVGAGFAHGLAFERLSVGEAQQLRSLLGAQGH